MICVWFEAHVQCSHISVPSDAMVCCKPVLVTSLTIGRYIICMIIVVYIYCLYFQFHLPVLLVMSLLLMETMRWRGGWRCAEVECGELFMPMLDGVSVMHKSLVDNWDTLLSVS